MREDIELLSSYRLIPQPAISWPIPWVQLDAAMEQAKNRENLPTGVLDALSRIQMHYEKELGKDWHMTSILRLNTAPPILRRFEDSSYNKIEKELRLELNLGNLYVSLGGGWRNKGQPHKFHYDQSYIAYPIAGWAIYAGYLSHWWGGGDDSALILSTSARPYPKVGFRSLQPIRFKSKYLSWIPPFSVEMNIGRLDKNRSDGADHSWIVMQRIELAPFKGFTLGFHRSTHICGKERKCSEQAWVQATLPVLGNTNTPGEDESDGELAFDLRYTNVIGKTAFHLYLQPYMEDSFEAWSYLTGVKFAHPTSFGMFRLGLEYMDTSSWRLLDAVGGQHRVYGSTYRNNSYADGNTYLGRPLGGSLDGDARLVSARASLTDKASRRFGINLRRMDLNLGSRENRSNVTATRERIWQGQIEGYIPMREGDLRLFVTHLSKKVTVFGYEHPRWSAGISWHVRY